MDERIKPAGTEHVPTAVHSQDGPVVEKRWGVVAVGFLAAGVLGFVLLQVLASQPQQVAWEVSAPLVQVHSVEIETGSLPVKGSGPVRPRAQVTLTSSVSGKIVEVSPALVTGGSFKLGDTLARIDSRTYRAALDQAKADRQALQADLAFAERQLQRDQQLTQSGAASERRRDETLNQRDRTRAQIAGLDALVAARAIDLERTDIMTPFDGRVFTEQVDVGSSVIPGSEIARIYATDIFEIVVPLSDREAALIPGLWDTDRTDAPRAVATLSYRGRLYTWDGYVERVEAGIDPDTRTIDVVVRIPNPTRRGTGVAGAGEDTLAEAPPMLIGTYAGVEIEGISVTYALIPRAALRNDNSVWLVNGDETLRVAEVDVIQDQGAQIAIRSADLQSGDRVIVSDLAIASDGLQVRVIESMSKSP